MISPQYPPMQGGVGRYVKNLINSIKKNVDVIIATDYQFPQSDTNRIISKGNYGNSQRILELVEKTNPDIVHIQYERTLFEKDPTPNNLFQFLINNSTLYKFCTKSKIPIVSTLHGVFPRKEYYDYFKKQIEKSTNKNTFTSPIRKFIRMQIVKKNYSYMASIAKISDEIIHLSKFSRDVIGKGKVIYIGAEPAFTTNNSKQKFRKEFGIASEKKLLLSLGHEGEDSFNILENIKLPQDWAIVIKNKNKTIDKKNDFFYINRGYLDENTLSKLFYACDAVILPRKIASTTGVLFDSFAHGLPFLGTNLTMFKEFSNLELGFVAKGTAEDFSRSFLRLSKEYNNLKKNVDIFKLKLNWREIGSQHIELYSNLIKK